MKKRIKKLEPIHPGEVLREEFLEPMGITQYRLANELCVPRRRINEIVHGERGISADTALRLSRFFGTSSEFWMNLQMRYDLLHEQYEKGNTIKKEVCVYKKKRTIMQEFVYKASLSARKLRITVKSADTCVVTVPKRLPMRIAERFVFEKREWIARKQEEIKKRAQEKCVLTGIRPFHEVKSEALCFTTQRVAFWNTQYGFSYRNISVRNQKTRWGSCSKHQNLTFNYRILYLPSHIADYLIVHELCHIKEFNHSQRFWNLVAQTIPAYQEIRRELKSVKI